MNPLLTIALRQNAVFIPKTALTTAHSTLNATTSVLCANAAKLGFAFDEPLLHALNGVSPVYKSKIFEFLKKVTGVDKNWTPLVKDWDIPTDVSIYDHLITLFHNMKGLRTSAQIDTEMPCGHAIPNGTFPLERYNGCPFCGTPFEFGKLEKTGQGSKLKVLTLWSEDDAQAFLHDLLQSKTALDATQIDSLKLLLATFPLPEKLALGIKETMVLVVDTLLEKGEGAKASACFTSPTDILRYLWFKHTGFLQIIEPKVLEKRMAKNAVMHSRYTFGANQKGETDKQAAAETAIKSKLDLKYDRKICLVVANWLNDVIGAANGAAEKTAEIMHPKRAMWVRFIRALRLAEYSKRKGMEPLARLLDVFYNQTYTVWEGRVSHFRLRSDADATFALLKQRPGAFARSLFANMLWFGDAETIAAFSEVSDAVPLRLLFTLNMYAENYFTKQTHRAVKPLGGINKTILAHPLLDLYDDAQLQTMKDRVAELCLATAQKHFAAQPAKYKKVFIDPLLYKMPIAIGDRSEAIQDRPVALMGTRFPMEGEQIRLFLQWGNGLPAQHLDMDLSCQITYPTHVDYCSYSNLTTTGCQHGGDIQQIPNKVGTAEYININLPILEKAGAKYVTFICNAFTSGALSPNLVVGWMDSKHPMHISPRTGVAYDPSCVQHEVRITQTITKGLVFGVLDVAAREVIWLEMAFDGQVAQNLSVSGVEALLAKLKSKLSIGALLELKAKAQNVAIVADALDADMVFDYNWAINAAAVTQVLLA
jgi:hypothetical protein